VSEREPLVSIVTPCYNTARFLEETICSVLSQDYPYIEYLVMDGGSTDGTREILERYRGRLRYISAPDHGQADAINRGFHLSRGSIFAFLNADDTYLPGAVATAVQNMVNRPDAGVVYGEAYHVGEFGQVIARYPVRPFDPAGLRLRCYICQPASFMRRWAFESAGMLDPQLHFALDYDLWIRIARQHTMLKIDQYLATSRIHPHNKTLRSLRSVFREVCAVLQKHYGYVPCNWLYGYGDYLLTGRNPMFEPPKPTLANLGLCFLLGSYYNPRHLLRYWKDMAATARSLRNRALL